MGLSANLPKISIVTVCFNSAKTIRKTIESVLNQTYTNLEYIIVDGNSTDNTLEIIKSYEQQFKHNNIIYRYISEPDNGIYDAMNKGIKMASGEWVGIINSDDWYELDACKNVFDAVMQDSTVEVIAGLCAMHMVVNNLDKIVSYVQNSFEEMFFRNQSMAHPSIFVRAKVYLTYCYDINFRIAADLELLMRLYVNGHRLKMIPNLISHFQYGGISNANSLNCAFEDLFIRRKYRRIGTLKYLLRYAWLSLKYYFRIAITLFK